MSLVLVWRTREFYRGDIYVRFRDAAVAATESPGDGASVAEQRPGHGGDADVVESTEDNVVAI